jgi:hypothetical protein
MLNLIVIELVEVDGQDYNPIFNEVDDITNFLTKMNIQNPDIDDRAAFPDWHFWDKPHTFSQKLYYSAKGLTIDGHLWLKVWVNPENGYVIAYEDANGKKFSPNFIDYMENIEPLDTGDLPCNTGKDFVRNNSHLSLDYILDKIGSKGIESLTMEEVNFLGDISKDL